jgi:hypothetical protein
MSNYKIGDTVTTEESGTVVITWIGCQSFEYDGGWDFVKVITGVEEKEPDSFGRDMDGMWY